MSQGIKNRIVGHGEVAPSQLMANPKNWRIHPDEQHKGMTEILERVGWVQSVIVNKRTNLLVDGHLRVSLAVKRNEEKIPVAFVDLSDEEDALILATLDPLGGLAVTDQAQIRSLLEGFQPAGVENLLDSIGFSFGVSREPKSVELRPFTKNHVLISMHEGCDLADVDRRIQELAELQHVEVTRAAN